MDQFPPPGPPVKFHARLVSAVWNLTLADLAAGVYCYKLVMEGDSRGGISGSAVFFGTEVSATSGGEGRSEKKRSVEVGQRQSDGQGRETAE